MKFLVFVKQVPLASEMKFDPVEKRLIREGVANEINAYDRRALSEAIRYRNEKGGSVAVATMGPAPAKAALLESILMGVDSCYHIEDSRLAGSDTLVTSRILAAAAKRIGYDIILCGQNSIDSETGQVPVEIAELLGIPCATAVRKIEYLPNGRVLVTSETDEGSMLLEMQLPAVISTAERLIKPIKTKNADLSVISDGKIQRWTLDDLGIPSDQVGVAGSPTWVAKIQDVRVNRKPEVWDGSDVSATAQRIVETVRSHKKKLTTTPIISPREKSHECWCWIEKSDNQIRSVSLEILSNAASVGKACAVVEGDLTYDEMEQLKIHGAEKIYRFENPSTTELHPDEIVSIFCERIVEQKPFAILFPATSHGKWISPRIAARLNLGLTGDCVALSMDEQGRLAQWKPAFGGNVVASIYSRTSPQMATIRPGALEIRRRRNPVSPEVVSCKPQSAVNPSFAIKAEEADAGAQAMDLDLAKIVIGVGMGLGQENITAARKLAELLDGSLAATRRVVDQGWLPRQFQVGLTGKFIHPDVYIGLGISGKYNHMVGIQKSGYIIAINQDPAADVFRSVNTGIVGDCAAITLELVRILARNQ